MIAAVAKALSILEHFAQRQEWGLSELSRDLQLHKATVFRLVWTLTALGYLERDGATGRLRLGRKFSDLETIARQEPIDWFSLGPLQDLAFVCGETAHLGVLHGRWVITMRVVESSATVRMRSWVGTRTPAHCSALGKVQLAFRDYREVENFVRTYGLPARTARTITDGRKFFEHLREVCERGYAVDNEETEEGLRCVAAPVALPSGRVIAAVSVSGPAWRLTPEKDAEVASLVTKAASEIAEGLVAFWRERG